MPANTLKAKLVGKPGRPRLPDTEKRTKISLYLSPHSMKILLDWKQKRGMRPNHVIDAALKLYNMGD
jgi:hypothetical protein